MEDEKQLKRHYTYPQRATRSLSVSLSTFSLQTGFFSSLLSLSLNVPGRNERTVRDRGGVGDVGFLWIKRTAVMGSSVTGFHQQCCATWDEEPAHGDALTRAASLKLRGEALTPMGVRLGPQARVTHLLFIYFSFYPIRLEGMQVVKTH